MNNRQSRTPSRPQPVPIARGPQSHSAAAAPQSALPSYAAPHAALLIDFDNVTMGIRSDLAAELKNLLSSNIVQGKIAIQRAYADWRRYPQYVLPLTEASIDLIYAPAYGSARKNATDIRLAIDAMELVFTRPEIGTIILLSGDSDFSSLVIKLKEYGKYVIGVGIRESSSDLLVQNCDEYYSYNALAGLVRSGDEASSKWDPWELVVEAVTRMRRNGDVMRSDRLKQVMQEIDNTFDEKNLGMSKFSRFVTEAAQRSLISMTKLENGQIEVGVPRDSDTSGDGAKPPAKAEAEPAAKAQVAPAPSDGQRAERGERGRGRRGRDRRGRREGGEREKETAAPAPAAAGATAPAATVAASAMGERLTRAETLDLIRRAVEAVSRDSSHSAPSETVRAKARELLGRDSDTLAERHFNRVLQDAHDADMIDLRRRGDTFEVARAAPAPTVAEQLGKEAGAGASAASQAALPGQVARPGSKAGRAGFGRRHGEIPAELLAIGVVDTPAAAAAQAEAVDAAADSKPAGKTKRKRAARKKKTAGAAASAEDTGAAVEKAESSRPASKKSPRRARKKSDAATSEASAESTDGKPAKRARKARTRKTAEAAAD